MFLILNSSGKTFSQILEKKTNRYKKMWDKWGKCNSVTFFIQKTYDILCVSTDLFVLCIEFQKDKIYIYCKRTWWTTSKDDICEARFDKEKCAINIQSLPFTHMISLWKHYMSQLDSYLFIWLLWKQNIMYKCSLSCPERCKGPVTIWPVDYSLSAQKWTSVNCVKGSKI